MNSCPDPNPLDVPGSNTTIGVAPLVFVNIIEIICPAGGIISTPGLVGSCK